MGKRIPEITAEVQRFIEQQPMYFVASAPLSEAGHINLSPKGLDTFRVLSSSEVAYLDVTGSGNETAAHVDENGRMTIMFCAFSGPPQIVRLYCHGEVITRRHKDWEKMVSLFPRQEGIRQVIRADVESAQTSCGFAVPEMMYVKQRDVLTKWTCSKTEDELVGYRRLKNQISFDGLKAPETD